MGVWIGKTRARSKVKEEKEMIAGDSVTGPTCPHCYQEGICDGVPFIVKCQTYWFISKGKKTAKVSCIMCKVIQQHMITDLKLVTL